MCNFTEHIILGSWTADPSGAYIVLTEDTCKLVSWVEQHPAYTVL